MLKLIYLAHRHPEFDSFDAFVRRWRLHGARGMEGDFWSQAVGYVQAEPIRPTPVAGTSEAFDAIACYMVRDDAFDAHPPDAAEARRIAQDELETFSAPIPTTALWVNEERVLEGDLGGATAFLFFAGLETAREVGKRALASGGFDRITVNVRNDDRPFGPRQNTLPYAAIVELSAPRIASLVRALAGEHASLLSAADPAVITREVVFWDRLTNRSSGGGGS